MARATWVDYRLFAYERRLAVAELKSLGSTHVTEDEQGFRFRHHAPDQVAARSTYFASIDADNRTFTCAQRVTELEHLSGRTRPQRQATRFGVHGFHEYKGKFNPQLARALINVVDPAAEVVADPFTGSGTTLVEALRLGAHARGCDRSPIATYMARAKVDTLITHDHKRLVDELTTLADEVGSALKRSQDRVRAVNVPWLSNGAHDFLRDWFTPPAYAALTSALAKHDGPAGGLASRLSLLSLSSMLRNVSLQEPQDLRVRRRPEGFVAPSLRDAYVDKVDRLLTSIGELAPWTDTATASIVMGNADDSDLFDETEGRRLIITSPPYATALPYIDTDRLSIVALGLAEPTALRTLEADLTGSREWKTAESKRWWTLLKANSASLPADVTRLLADLVTANEETGAGFRRAAVPPLLYRYFCDMRDCFTSWAKQLRPGEFAVVVVGRNRTGPAGAQTLIDTPTLLGSCARQVGFDVADQILLETWPRFGLHAANGVQGEDALVLRRT